MIILILFLSIQSSLNKCKEKIYKIFETHNAMNEGLSHRYYITKMRSALYQVENGKRNAITSNSITQYEGKGEYYYKDNSTEVLLLKSGVIVYVWHPVRKIRIDSSGGIKNLNSGEVGKLFKNYYQNQKKLLDLFEVNSCEVSDKVESINLRILKVNQKKTSIRELTYWTKNDDLLRQEIKYLKEGKEFIQEVMFDEERILKTRNIHLKDFIYTKGKLRSDIQNYSQL